MRHAHHLFLLCTRQIERHGIYRFRFRRQHGNRVALAIGKALAVGHRRFANDHLPAIDNKRHFHHGRAASRNFHAGKVFFNDTTFIFYLKMHIHDLLRVGGVHHGGPYRQAVAVAHEARHVGFYHQRLRSGNKPVDRCRQQVFRIGNGRKLPLRIAVGHIERKRHFAIFARHKPRKEKCRLHRIVAQRHFRCAAGRHAVRSPCQHGIGRHRISSQNFGLKHLFFGNGKCHSRMEHRVRRNIVEIALSVHIQMRRSKIFHRIPLHIRHAIYQVCSHRASWRCQHPSRHRAASGIGMKIIQVGRYRI